MHNEVRAQKELNRLEQAAEETAIPEQIEQKASQDGKGETTEASHLWFLPFLIAAAAVGGGIFFLDWGQAWIKAPLSTRLHRYLFGALASILVLAAMRAVEIYLISRIGNRVSRFNLKRILRLLAGLGFAATSLRRRQRRAA